MLASIVWAILIGLAAGLAAAVLWQILKGLYVGISEMNPSLWLLAASVVCCFFGWWLLAFGFAVAWIVLG